jgi:hypothetical protein
MSGVPSDGMSPRYDDLLAAHLADRPEVPGGDAIPGRGNT